MPRYFKRRWEENRGDARSDWGASWWLFEVNEQGEPSRQIEIYDHAPATCYGPDLIEDADGGRAYDRLDGLEDWTRWEISAAEFEAAWSTES